MCVKKQNKIKYKLQPQKLFAHILLFTQRKIVFHIIYHRSSTRKRIKILPIDSCHVFFAHVDQICRLIIRVIRDQIN